MRLMQSRLKAIAVACVALLLVALSGQTREREPNEVYAGRRARLIEQLKAPVVLFSYTGRENSAPSYIFNQEENFYYLTGHNEEGAALLLVPTGAAEAGSSPLPREILFLPPRNFTQERWNGPRIGPEDPGVEQKTGVASVEPFGNLKGRLAALAK